MLLPAGFAYGRNVSVEARNKHLSCESGGTLNSNLVHALFLCLLLYCRFLVCFLFILLIRFSIVLLVFLLIFPLLLPRILFVFLLLFLLLFRLLSRLLRRFLIWLRLNQNVMCQILMCDIKGDGNVKVWLES